MNFENISPKEIKQGYFINKYGAKVYFDATKQPALPLCEGENKYHVLSVGFDANKIPTVTVMMNGKAACYRIPDEYKNWAINCVHSAQTLFNVFPKDVVFTLKGKNYFVDMS